MKFLRRFELWLTLAILLALATLSIVGALLGAQKAWDFFNSPIMTAFWMLFIVLLTAGIVSFPRLIKSPGRLATHLGCILVVIGGIMSSDPYHDFKNLGHAYSDITSVDQGSRPSYLISRQIAKYVPEQPGPAGKPASGYVTVAQQNESDELRDSNRNPVAKLPFLIHLNRFWIDYYDLKDKRWQLWIELPAPPNEMEPNEHTAFDQLDWKLNQDTLIPGTRLRVQPVTYLEHARAVVDEAKTPFLEITTPEGKVLTLPTKAGSELAVPGTDVKVRILQLYKRLQVRIGENGKNEAFERPDGPDNPAMKIEIESADGSKQPYYVFPNRPMHGMKDLPMNMRYAIETKVVPDESSPTPAMEVVVKRGNQSRRAWLVPPVPNPQARDPAPARLELGSVLGMAPEQTPVAEAENQAVLYLATPRKDIKSFNSDLSIVKDNEQVLRQTIGVNHPLHYGGYHIYQNSYDSQGEQFTVLFLKSDWGLLPVWIGFTLICMGVMWSFWLVPAVGYLTRRDEVGA